MDTEPDDSLPRPTRPDLIPDIDSDATEPATLPPVVAVVITEGGIGLEATLASLVDQDYPSLSTLVVDRGTGDDPTSRVAEVYPHAFIRRLRRPHSFAEAANVAFGSIEGATFFLICRDDIVVEPGGLRVLVEEAYRSNAAVVGPKIVDLDRPDVLVEVGLSIDRYGIAFTGIEPGELDQEQHDAVRDVFCVTDAAMLLRTDLVEELDGFDPRAEPGAADLDLCWRARLIGARVVVAPDARVRRRSGVSGRSGA